MSTLFYSKSRRKWEGKFYLKQFSSYGFLLFIITYKKIAQTVPIFYKIGPNGISPF